MKAQHWHEWRVLPAQALEIQRSLAGRVSKRDEVGAVALVAGVDISPIGAGLARAAVVVLSYPELTLAETETIEESISFPYVPGLLSFRESPLILAACERLSIMPDLIMVDGQGIAHPRRLGLASHLGLLWDKPTLGCAKSRLCGQHQAVGVEAGRWTELVADGEVIGAAVRTKEGAAPLYISIGHKVDLPGAIGWVLRCGHGYRLPEPIRLAHLAATGRLEQKRPGPQGFQAQLL